MFTLGRVCVRTSGSGWKVYASELSVWSCIYPLIWLSICMYSNIYILMFLPVCLYRFCLRVRPSICLSIFMHAFVKVCFVNSFVRIHVCFILAYVREWPVCESKIVSLSILLFARLTARHFVFIIFCACFCPFVCPPVGLSVCMHAFTLSICMFAFRSCVRSSVVPIVYLSVCLYVWMYVWKWYLYACSWHS